MENFEPITKIEPRVDCSFPHTVLQYSESISDFIYSVQKGKTLYELLLNVDEKQKKLIRLLSDCIVCLSFLFSDSARRKEFLLPCHNERVLNTNDISQIIKLMEDGVIFSSKLLESESSLISYVNRLCRGYFKIYESGAKGMERAAEKTRVKLKGNHTLLNDTIRITITALYPEYFDYIINYLRCTNNVFAMHKQWTISPSGILHKDCYLNIDGNIAQIAMDEVLQREINITCSHKIYEVMRLLESENFQFSIEHIEESTPRKFMEGYNRIMEEYGQTTDSKFNKIEDISFFQVDELHSRYKELLLLHQSIHVNAICSVDKKWQELYCSLMEDMNNKDRLQHKEETFSKFLLEKFPKYEKEHRFRNARMGLNQTIGS